MPTERKEEKGKNVLSLVTSSLVTSPPRRKKKDTGSEEGRPLSRSPGPITFKIWPVPAPHLSFLPRTRAPGGSPGEKGGEEGAHAPFAMPFCLLLYAVTCCALSMNMGRRPHMPLVDDDL